MVSDINLWIVLPLCTLAFFTWVGFYLFITLTVMRHDPREIKFRETSGKKPGLFPDELFSNKTKENHNAN